MPSVISLFLLGCFTAVLGFLASNGQVRLPLPFPANEHEVEEVPPGTLPLRPSRLEGRFKAETLLRNATRLVAGQVQGSESVVVHPDGSLILLDKYGYVWRAVSSTQIGQADPSYQLLPKPITHLGPGRPLGAALDADQNLLICDSFKGLLMLEAATNRLALLTSRVSTDSPIQPDTPIVYANDLDIAADGTIYFTDCQNITVARNRLGFWDTLRSYTLGLLSGSFTGRLLKYNPATGSTHVLAEHIWYANGVALSQNESFVAVVETNQLRVLRYWLQGPKAGTADVLIDHLPGFPDGIDRAEGGSFWISVVAPVLPAVQLPIVARRWARALFAWLPDAIRPKPARQGLVIKVSEDGTVQRVLSDPDGSHVAFVSAAHEHDGGLLLGNLVGDYVSFLPASLLAAAPK